MQRFYSLIFIVLSVVFTGCQTDSDSSPSTSGEASADIADSSGNGNGDGQNNAGLITAGEWNDLDNWSFWNDLLGQEETFNETQEYWGYYPKNRVDVQLNNQNGEALVDAQVHLKVAGATVWEARTDNFGKAVLWAGLNEGFVTVQEEDLTVEINGSVISQEITLFENGINTVVLNESPQNSNTVALSFVVDATGSMYDEIAFLKADLQNVIEQVGQDNPTLDIHMSSVFYRDEGDLYVTRESPMTTNLSTTINFIQEQNSGGGGDYPEAVEQGLGKAIHDLQWPSQAKTRIAFLLLDAPPHYEPQVIDYLHTTIATAANEGIKVIPISASGIDKPTEFLLRYFAMSTNGTYVFITNDSGIGNDHIEASVGEYEVEFLNELLIRLIKKYSA